MRDFIASKWPLTKALPLAVSATILVVSLAASVIGVLLLQNYVNATLEQKAAVFLDGFAGHIAPNGPLDPTQTQAALRNALEYQSIMGESSTAIGRMIDGRLVMHSYPQQEDPSELNATLQVALNGGAGTSIFTLQDGHKARLTKVYERAGVPFALSTLFDASDAVRTNQVTIWIAIAINGALALVSIVITFLVTRRIAFSLRSLSHRLAPDAENSLGGGGGSELASLETALVLREQNEAIRSKALESMAQAERDALLGRVAAVIAHEVRNPLAGILSALSTIRRFGDDKAVREETLDIVEGGLKSLERIANVTLATYRRRGGQKRINVSDIQDLELLIAPEARKRELKIAWYLEGKDAFYSDADAVRQIMVNLLLNACKASPIRGTVDIAVVVGLDEARLSVSDHGPGLPDAILDYLQAPPASSILPPTRELGISVICALVQDIGARLSVESRAGEGTTISIIVPLDKEEAVDPV